MNNIFLTPKIILPKKPPNIIERYHLEKQLDAQTEKRLIIFKAPAGYGKTTLLNSWLQKKFSNIAWVSLDESDNNPVSFWTYIVTSIAKTTSFENYHQLIQLLHIQNQTSFELFIYNLIEEVSKLEPLHIVLDDFHYINLPSIHNLFIQFIEYLPDHVHVYITTRSTPPFPMMKWLVKQWLYELDLHHFKFNRGEVRQFFLQRSNQMLDERQLERIYKTTEGWVSGLLLMTLANNQVSIPKVSSLNFISEFLWDEIILKLPKDSQLFLLQTSFLRELTPELCNEITGRKDSELLLQQLEQQGLFTLKLQTIEPTYRYHYLLIDTLQQRFYQLFEKDETFNFIQKVAEIHCNNANYDYAINLVLRNEQYALAAKWMDTYFVEIIQSIQIGQFLNWVREIVNAQVFCNDEIIIMGFIQATLALDYEFAEQLKELIEIRQQQDQWFNKAEKTNCIIYFLSAKALYLVGLGNRLPEVIHLLQNRLDLQYTPDRWGNFTIDYNNFEVNLLRTSLASKGKMLSIQEIEKVIHLFRYTNLNEIDVALHIFSVCATMFYEQNELQKAEKEIEEVISYGLKNDLPHLYIPMYILKAKIFIHNNQVTTAQIMLEQMLQKVRENHWKNAFKTMIAQCYLELDDIENAKFLLNKGHSLHIFDRLIYVKLLLKENKYKEALKIIIDIQMIAKEEQQLATIIEATIFEAICHIKMNSMELACHAIHNVLPIASHNYYLRLFLDNGEILPVLKHYINHPTFSLMASQEVIQYIEQILIHAKKVYDAATDLQLTDREKEILTLIAEGNSNREIATKLYLSEGTVRVYISNLYQKIDVKSRSQAIKFFQKY
ncbi:MAG: LuxR C-terminal-related transcriptional regulator [Solibacillus sp.]